MSLLYQFIAAVFKNWFLYMTAGPFLADEVLKRVSPSLRDKLGERFPVKIRRRIEVGLIIFGVFYAGFAAFKEEHAARQIAENALKNATPIPMQFQVTETDTQARKELQETKKKLQTAETTVQKLQSLADAEMEYGDIAALNMIGKPYPDGDVVFHTTISKALEGAYIVEGTRITYKTDSTAEQKFRDTISVDARFPFSYVGLGVILRNRNDSNWRELLIKAEEIFKKTTMIPGHHSNHDEFLEKTREILASDITPPFLPPPNMAVSPH